MDYKKEIQDLLSALKRSGFTRRRIEKDLEYGEKSIDQILAKGGNKSFLGILRFYARTVLNNSIPENTTDIDHIEDEPASYSTAGEDLRALSALVVELLHLEIAREAGGNSEKEKEIRRGILQRIGPKLSSDLKRGISADGGR